MFFKKNKNKVQEKKVEISEQDKNKLKEKIVKQEEALKNENNTDERVSILNELGKEYKELNCLDEAISNFEDSLSTKEQFGDAYNNLLTLYESKRKKAAQEGLSKEVQKWVGKTEKLMVMSKRVMKSKM